MEYLDIEQEELPRARERRRHLAKNARLMTLVRLVNESGFKRPALGQGQHQKVRGRRGRRAQGV